MRKILFIPVFVLGVISQMEAQSDIMLYNFKGVAQSNLLNPAIRTDQRFTFGVVTGVFSVHNSGFSAYDLMARGSNLDNNITNILNQIRENDFIRVNAETDILYTSFNINDKMQLSFGGRLSSLNHMTLPVNLLHLIKGNDQPMFRNQEVQLGGFSFETTMLMSYHVGMQYQVNDKLSVGLRTNRHHGIYNATINKNENDIIMYFGDEEFRVRNNSTVRTSTIMGPIDSIGDGLDFSANTGLSFDIGGEYIINEKWTVSASVLGLGYITYNSNVREWQSKGDFKFEGVEVDLRDGRVRTGEVIDTLAYAFEFISRDGEPYRRGLPTQIFLGGEYKLHPKHRLNSVIRYTNWTSNSYFDFNFRYIWAPTRHFHAIGNLSMVQGRVFGGGLGFQTYAPGIQLYVMADVMTSSIYVTKFRGAFLSVGLNVALWDKSRYKKDNTPTITE
jgi:hypothetical protein